MANGIKDFFTDPKNLATGLVFLAALAQPRREGQSTVGAFGERAVGALGFRGGLEKGILADRRAEEERERQARGESRRQELEERRTKVAEQGLGLQRQQLEQTGQTAKAQRDLELQLKSMPDALTPEQRALLTEQAGYYSRMPKGTGEEGGPGAGIFDPQKLTEEFLKQRLKAEIDRTAMSVDPATGQPVQPDLAGVIADLYAFARPLQGIPPGAQITSEGGQLFVDIPDPSGGTQRVPLAGGAPPTATPTPAAVQPSVRIETPQAAVALSRPVVSRPKSRTGAQLQSASEFGMRQQLEGLSDERLNQIIKTKNVSLDIIKTARLILHDRRMKQRAEMSSQPGLR